jgi:hypothetical protein
MIAAHGVAIANPVVRAKMSEGCQKMLADPVKRAIRTAASKKAWADPATRARMSGFKIGIPAWVPGYLYDEFIQTAREQGEFEAARCVRLLKREAERSII